MNLKEFKNKKIVAIIGILSPLLIIFGIVMKYHDTIDLNYLNNAESIILLILMELIFTSVLLL